MNRHMTLHRLSSGLLALFLLLMGLPAVAAAATGPEPTPSAPIMTDLRIDGVGAVDPKTGQATIYGTVTCAEPTVLFFTTSLQQRVGRSIIHGLGFADVACEGVTRWSTTVRSHTGLFVAGRAQASAMAEYYHPETGEIHGDQTGNAIKLVGAR